MSTTSSPAPSYSAEPNLHITAHDGVEYAYRDIGQGGARPLLLLQHFR